MDAIFCLTLQLCAAVSVGGRCLSSSEAISIPQCAVKPRTVLSLHLYICTATARVCKLLSIFPVCYLTTADLTDWVFAMTNAGLTTRYLTGAAVPRLTHSVPCHCDCGLVTTDCSAHDSLRAPHGTRRAQDRRAPRRPAHRALQFERP